MRRWIAFALALAMCAPRIGRAQVDVRILAMPTEVYSFEPVLVLFSVRNVGSEAVLLPGDIDGVVGYLEFREKGAETWRSVNPWVSMVSGGAKSAAWVNAGESRLALVDASYLFAPEGRYEIRAALASGGDCFLGELPGAPTENSVNARKPLEVLTCTDFRSESESVEVKVIRPQDEEDIRAWSFLGQPARIALVGLGKRFSELAELFPKSHYTYAAAFRANRLSDAIRLQPENPLNTYLAAELVTQGLRLGQCFDAPFAGERDLAATTDMTEGLRGYVRQQVEYHRRRCTAAPAPGN